MMRRVERFPVRKQTNNNNKQILKKRKNVIKMMKILENMTKYNYYAPDGVFSRQLWFYQEPIIIIYKMNIINIYRYISSQKTKKPIKIYV